METYGKFTVYICITTSDEKCKQVALDTKHNVSRSKAKELAKFFASSNGYLIKNNNLSFCFQPEIETILID